MTSSVQMKRCVMTGRRRRQNIFFQIIKEENITTTLDRKQTLKKNYSLKSRGMRYYKN